MRILKEGFPFIYAFKVPGAGLLAVAVFVKSLPEPVFISCIVLGVLFVVFAGFCVVFFRDPKINITQAGDQPGEGIILSPCDGTVMEVAQEGDEKVVRVFLSIFNVHLQRAPVNGTVTGVVHKDGKFFAAWNPRAHIENEQNIFTIQSKDGIYHVRQIAGLVARRCVSWVKAGDMLKAGDKIGMIKFSSQVDLHLPKTATVNVKPGDKTKAGITIMAIQG